MSNKFYHNVEQQQQHEQQTHTRQKKILLTFQRLLGNLIYPNIYFDRRLRMKAMEKYAERMFLQIKTTKLYLWDSKCSHKDVN